MYYPEFERRNSRLPCKFHSIRFSASRQDEGEELRDVRGFSRDFHVLTSSEFLA